MKIKLQKPSKIPNAGQKDAQTGCHSGPGPGGIRASDLKAPWPNCLLVRSLDPLKTQNPKSKIPPKIQTFLARFLGFWNLDFAPLCSNSLCEPPGGPILDFGFWILDLGFWILGLGSWILDFGVWILDFGFWILDFGFWTSEFGFWILEDSVAILFCANFGSWISNF